MRAAWLAAGALCACTTPGDPSVAGQAIIGGAVETGHAYVVGVDDNADTLDCSGVLVSKRTVLTAAHCPAPTRVFFGSNVLAAGSPPRTEIAVVQRVAHPSYSGSPNFYNDLALLQLAADGPVQPATLLRQTMTNTPGLYTTTSSTPGPKFTTVGYGFTAVGSNDYGTRRVGVWPVNTVGAATFNDGVDSFNVDASQFFYKSVGKNQCAGDSGGPTFLTYNRVERVAGVVSLGDMMCEVGFDARADAPQITAFIQATIDSFESGNACRADGVCTESCNTGGAIGDPDCAEAHCGMDGVCATACVLPIDPDCPVAPHCGVDGVCDKTCPTFDPDCAPLCAAEGTCLTSCPSVDPDCVAADAGADGGGADGGAADQGNADLAGTDGGAGTDQGCSTSGRPDLTPLALLVLALALTRRRRPA